MISSDAKLIIAKLILAVSVEGGHHHELRLRVAGDQLLQQQMKRAAKGVLCSVREGAKRSVSMTEIVGSAKYNHNIGIGNHLINPGSEISVPLGFRRWGILNGDAGASHPITKALGTASPANHVPVKIRRI